MKHPNFNPLLKGSLALSGLALASCSAQAAPAKSTTARPTTSKSTPARPNIIFVLADDMGYSDLTCYGGKGVQSKNIDRLAAEGIRFTQFYVNSPICSPSRTAFTTGQYPARWRITSFIEHRSSNQERGMAQWLDLKAPTLARSLAGAGYLTGHFGKWHLGGGRDVGEAPLPTEYGYAASLTQFEGLGPRVLPIMSAQNGQPAEKVGLGLASEKLGRGQVRWLPRSQVTKAFVDRSLDFIKEAEKKDKPFYINVWPDDVHSPFDPPQDLRGDASKRALYRGVLTNMDRQLGPLFDYVRNSPKLRSNTLIIFASDNGPEPGAGLAGSFKGSKGQLYEGGIREPLIVWGPGFIPANRRGTTNSSTVVAAVDLLPSVLSVTGIKNGPKGDGVDVSSAWEGKVLNGRTQPLFWRRPPDRPGNANNPLPDLAVRDGNWKLLVQLDGSGAQLYNLATDASETTNVAAKQPQVVQRLKQQVLDWNKTLPVDGVAATSQEQAESAKPKRTQFNLKSGAHLGRRQAPQIANRGFTITAKFDAQAPGGVLVAQGGVAQGYSLSVDENGKLVFLVRIGTDAAFTSIATPSAVTGVHQVVARLSQDRTLTLTLDGQVVAQAQTPELLQSQPLDGLNVGSDQGGLVGPYTSASPWNGTIESIVIELATP